MQGAFSFYGNEPARPKRPERLFYALFPDPITSRRIGQFSEQFIRQHRLEGTPIKRARRHLTLQPVGDYPRLRSKFVYAARQAGHAVSMSPFDVEFGFIMSFEGAPSLGGMPRRRPLVMLGAGEGLLELHKILGATMIKNGLRATAHFTPHMTLLYGPKPILVQPIEPIRFVVTEFALVHSELWRTHYNMIDRWSLKG
jgi:RNA 2',3'-cyclic 3'-phosphodiesterase